MPLEVVVTFNNNTVRIERDGDTSFDDVIYALKKAIKRVRLEGHGAEHDELL